MQFSLLLLLLQVLPELAQYYPSLRNLIPEAVDENQSGKYMLDKTALDNFEKFTSGFEKN